MINFKSFAALALASIALGACAAPVDAESSASSAQASTAAGGVGSTCTADASCDRGLVCEPICPVIPNLEHCMIAGGSCEPSCSRSASSLAGETFTSADEAHSITFTGTTFTKTDGCPNTGIHCMHIQQTQGTYSSNGTTITLYPTGGNPRDTLTVESHCYEGLVDKSDGVELWPTTGN
jgi:hypothetical protein